MRHIETIHLGLVFLAMAAAGAGAQLDSSAPANGTAQAAAQTTAATPDRDGVYRVEGDVESPEILQGAQAIPPAGVQADHLRMVRLTAVIKADGTVGHVEAFTPNGSPLQEAAATAVKQSKFAAGTLNGAPVPVLVCVRVPFFGVSESIPRLFPCPRGGALMENAGVRPPRLLYAPDPQYSDQARRKRIQGIVVISTRVDEQGNPTDLRVEQSLGYGLDEQAMDAVSHYRFSPAMRDGKPVATRIKIEVSFRLYR